ncbi:hypothetical protein ACFOSD_10190 [Salinispirillum marinum]|uniref:CopG family transcriptional regulator n=2 Tax=Saccharospirillaceae TaxID=255527 RepID=A0ABV8BFY0_9GAMM
MSSLSKKSVVYFAPTIHQALKMKAASSGRSASEIIDEAVRLLISDDKQDLAEVAERAKEPEMSYEALIHELSRLTRQP